MKSEFKAKLLQHVLNKKDSEKGFTLIELLVVIIIIGILAAIALPSFLNQSNKAKQSEAKTYVGSLNKGQQAYFTEKSRFGSDINILGIGVKTSTVNYTYNTSNAAYDSTTPSNNNATSVGNTQSVALRSYAGKVQLGVATVTSDVTSLASLCENNTAGTAAITPLNGPATTGPTCDALSQAVGN
jgi:type IV pilus assembly protein PilA